MSEADHNLFSGAKKESTIHPKLASVEPSM